MIPGITASQPGEATAVVIYQNDFDSGWADSGDLIFSGYCDPTGSTRQNPQTNDAFTPSNGQFTRTTDQQRAGTHSAKCIVSTDYACYPELPTTQELKIRSRMIMGSEWGQSMATGGTVLTGGEEYWIGCSLYIPASNSLGNPPRTLMLGLADDDGGISLRSNNGNFELLDGGEILGAIVQDQWADFVVRLQINSASDGGFVEWWMDGVKKVSRSYIVQSNQAGPPVSKTHRVAIGGYFGNYEAGGFIDTNLPFDVYVDSVKIAHGTNGYSLVNPGTYD